MQGMESSPLQMDETGAQQLIDAQQEHAAESSNAAAAGSPSENHTNGLPNAASMAKPSEPHVDSQGSAADKNSSDFVLEPLKVSPSSEDLFHTGELSENFQTRGVRVVVRCRPLLAHERDHEQQCMTIDKESKSVTLQR